MLAILPILSLILLAVAIHRWLRNSDRDADWRFSSLLAAVIWGLFLVGVTEALSLPSLLTAFWAGCAWVLATLLAAMLCIHARSGQSGGGFSSRVLGVLPETHPQAKTLGGGTPHLRSDRALARFDWFELCLLLAVGALLAAVLVTAVVAAPNSMDALTYHLPRVEHWVQDASVRNYPTNITRQVQSSPMAEFALLHLRLLSGGDRLYNLVQFVAMAGCLLAVSLIAAQLGAGRRGQVLAVVACATIPGGVLEASGPLNDCVYAFWLTCLAASAMAMRKRFSWPGVLLGGGGLALAVLTKPVAYLYALPLVIWLAATCIRALRWGAWKPALAAAILLVAVNAGHWSRNIATFGTITGNYGSSDAGAVYTNASFAPRFIVSNLVRNAGLHLSLPWSGWTCNVENAVLWVHRSLGTCTTDWRSTWYDNGRYYVSWNYDESASPNTLHFLLTLAVLAFAFFARPTLGRAPAIYMLCVVTAFVLFCVVLRWQVWAARLHLAIFVLFCPATGLVLARWGRSGPSKAGRLRPLIPGCIALVLLAGAAPFAMLNKLRPLVGERNIFRVDREEQYFAVYPNFTPVYRYVADRLRQAGIARVGLVTRENDLEYPMWVLLRNRFNAPVRLEHVNVSNASAGTPNASPGSAEGLNPPEATIQWRGPPLSTRLMLLLPDSPGEASPIPSAPIH